MAQSETLWASCLVLYMNICSDMESKVLYPALFAFTLLYLLLAFVWRSVLVWRRTGANPYVLPQDDSPQGYVGAAMRLLMGSH